MGSGVCPRPSKHQEMSGEELHIELYSLKFVPDHFRTQEICDAAVRIEPYLLEFVPDHLKKQ